MARTKLVRGVVIPFTPEEEAARDAEEAYWSSTVAPIEQAKREFTQAKNQARNFDEEETDILLAGYLEVKLVRLAILLGQTPGDVDTPVIDALNAVFPGQTKLQLAQTIENRAQNYLTQAATALGNKIKNGG